MFLIRFSVHIVAFFCNGCYRRIEYCYLSSATAYCSFNLVSIKRYPLKISPLVLNVRYDPNYFQRNQKMASRQPIYLNPSAATERCDPVDTLGPRQLHQSLRGYGPTPLVNLPDLASDLGVRAVFLKDESNRFGLPAFKILGAAWGCYRALASLYGLSISSPTRSSLDELASRAQQAGVILVAATEGNHGRAVAYMANKVLGVRAIIFVPEHMHESTQQLIAGEGPGTVAVQLVHGDYDAAVREAAEYAARTSTAVLIQDTSLPPDYVDVPGWIVEGYATMMAEVEEQLAALGLVADAVVVPVGVGSLAHAVARYCKSRDKPVLVVTVEPDTAACLWTSLRAGKHVTVSTSETIMAGLNCGTASATAWPDLQRLVDVAVTVSCRQSHEAVGYLASPASSPLLSRPAVAAGPCGAATVAALWRLAKDPDAGKAVLGRDSVVVVLSTEGPREYSVPPKS